MNKSMVFLLCFIIVVFVLLIVLYLIITIRARREQLLENQAEVKEIKEKKVKENNKEALMRAKKFKEDVIEQEEYKKEKEQEILESLEEDEMALSKKTYFDNLAIEDKLKKEIETVPQEKTVDEKREVDVMSTKDQRNRSTILGVETYIEGDLVVDGDLEILGAVKGNIQCSGNMRVLGKVDGNIQSSGLYVDAILMKGDLYCEEKLENKEGTTIQGSITARIADIEGEVEGSIHVSELLILGDCAAVNGDIAAGDIEIHRGAYIQGQVSIITEEESNT